MRLSADAVAQVQNFGACCLQVDNFVCPPEMSIVKIEDSPQTHCGGHPYGGGISLFSMIHWVLGRHGRLPGYNSVTPVKNTGTKSCPLFCFTRPPVYQHPRTGVFWAPRVSEVRPTRPKSPPNRRARMISAAVLPSDNEFRTLCTRIQSAMRCWISGYMCLYPFTAGVQKRPRNKGM